MRVKNVTARRGTPLAMSPLSDRAAAVRRARARPALVGAIAVTLVAGAAFVLVWFQPQALLFDTVVEDAFPVPPVGAVTPATPGGGTAAGPEPTGGPQPDRDGEPTPEPSPEPSPEPTPEPSPEPTVEAADGTGPVSLATGTFASRNRYTVEGRATVYEVDGAGRVLRLEGFRSTNGPDLFVYLTAAHHTDGDERVDEEFVDLGVLRGNVGDQNYDIPDTVDLERYDTVVIWCRRFTVSFGAADLVPSR